jgi:hypothetical protein
MSLVLSGSTSGSVTLQEPAIAGTTVLDLPATSGTVLVGGTQNIPKSALPTGSVLQVVQASATTATTTTSNSFQTTSHSVTITPTSSSSKILVIHQGMVNSLASAIWCYSTIFRNASVNLYAGGSADAAGGVYVSGSGDYHSAITMMTLDSPATTSATTYTVYFKNNNNAASVRYNADGWKLYTIAMEIAA